MGCIESVSGVEVSDGAPDLLGNGIKGQMQFVQSTIQLFFEMGVMDISGGVVFILQVFDLIIFKILLF